MKQLSERKADDPEDDLYWADEIMEYLDIQLEDIP